MEVMELVWIWHDYEEMDTDLNSRQPNRKHKQSNTMSNYSQHFYTSGGHLPQFVTHSHGSGQGTHHTLSTRVRKHYTC